MINLVGMNQEQYEALMKLSERDQIEGHVRDGSWRPEEAEANMARAKAQFLPLGLATPNHYFWAVVDADPGAEVGGLWVALAEEDGQRQFWVFEIQVYEPYRRRGYGTQAFLAMEEKAREMGVTSIALHVFADNHPARAMYQKLGYTGIDTQMVKVISAPV
ncbi:MAG: GNAT family N-acetyltransferase [Anaerolineae bacterium]|jgi:GNAT superfamily N-acetyltransferase